MTFAFKDGGPLSDTSLDPGERVAMMGLFQGAIGVFKNPPSHRPVEYSDPADAALGNPPFPGSPSSLMAQIAASMASEQSWKLSHLPP